MLRFKEEEDFEDDDHEKPAQVEDIESRLRAVLRLLHTSGVPTKLPCREEEYEEIREFIERTVKENGRSRVMYVTGVPGTGKTATVTQVIVVGIAVEWDSFRTETVLVLNLCFEKKNMKKVAVTTVLMHFLTWLRFGFVGIWSVYLHFFMFFCSWESFLLFFVNIVMFVFFLS